MVKALSARFLPSPLRAGWAFFCLTLLLSPPALAAECVILLHGLARTEASMNTLAEALEAADYWVVNYHYPSTSQTIEELAQQAIEAGTAQCDPGSDKVHFVTHSMGGILVRQYLHDNTIDKLGRVVMLGPPNQGSEVVDKLAAVPGFELINGPAGLQLGTGQWSVPNNLGPANFEVGVIAGSRSINLILSTLLPDRDDGKVTVENTRLEGMRDHITLPVTHPFMMRNPTVIEQVIYFLRHGTFRKTGPLPR